MRHLWAGALVLSFALGAGASEEPAPPRLRVLAAASLTDTIAALGLRFGAARVEASFAASSELARQIADGAPADVFLSASPEWTAYLRERGALAGEPVVFARNTLVCVAPRKSSLRAAGASDLRSLANALGEHDLVAIADAGVPAGEYARQALTAAGVAERLRGRLVGRKDVRAVLQSVESGEMNAGFVYASDARAADVAVLFALDPATHAPIVYEAAVVAASTHRALAQRFVAFLRTAEAQRELARAGFAPPSQ
jgi:molybdate transport system substrate-binding protein